MQDWASPTFYCQSSQNLLHEVFNYPLNLSLILSKQANDSVNNTEQEIFFDTWYYSCLLEFLDILSHLL